MKAIKNGKFNKENNPIHAAFGHGWIGRHIVEPIVREIAKEGFGYKYTANGDGTNGHGTYYAGPVEISNGNVKLTPERMTTMPTSTSSKPAAYSRTTAKTAADIAQGGMTKDEVEDFNLKHPNETAIRGN